VRSTKWQWWVSFLLLLATMINYMDRQTLANLAVRIKEQFSLSSEQYGDIESLFGVTFAAGSLVFGFLVDKVSVRWLYPVALAGWSIVGMLTGFATGYYSLLVCRGFLGFFEAGHWPCALVVTQRILTSRERVLGNSILQSGASIGAIITPLLIQLMVRGSEDESIWRTPFIVIGAAGLVWVVFWFWVVGPRDLLPPVIESDLRDNTSVSSAQETSWIGDLFQDRRFWGLVAMVVCINTSWQLIRAWLPMFLEKGRGYSESTALYFNSIYYIATDIGCIGAGIGAAMLAKRGLSVHSSRVLVYLVCAMFAALSTIAALLPQGYLLLAVLLLVGAGSLGVFPCYYSFTQEYSATHMGRVTGILSCLGWLLSAPTHKLFGWMVDRTGTYDWNIAVLGWAPLVGLLFFLFLWPRASMKSE
jgi:ACS family hexuronate transporter-like MFS transporter